MMRRGHTEQTAGCIHSSIVALWDQRYVEVDSWHSHLELKPTRVEMGMGYNEKRRGRRDALGMRRRIFWTTHAADLKRLSWNMIMWTLLKHLDHLNVRGFRVFKSEHETFMNLHFTPSKKSWVMIFFFFFFKERPDKNETLISSRVQENGCCLFNGVKMFPVNQLRPRTLFLLKSKFIYELSRKV